MSEPIKQHGIILFDGFCNLCSGTVHFLIKKDRKDHFRFCSLQSEAGKALLKKFHLTATANQSVILIEQNKIWRKSDAFCRIMRKLPGIWKVFYLAIIIPPFIRDGVYEFISQHRYQWFGRRNTCSLPIPGAGNKFIE
jgi:predicted DCC family thiol-disulfide oxidoreductase YuxK